MTLATQTSTNPYSGKQLLFQIAVRTTIGSPEKLRQQYYRYYRRAIRDGLSRSNRKPFQCGGLQGYDQLLGIARHLRWRYVRYGPDPYLDELQQRVSLALEAAHDQAEAVRQAHSFLVEVERCLAEVPLPTLTTSDDLPHLPTPGSEVVKQTLKQMFSDRSEQSEPGSTLERLLDKWQRMSPTWLPGIFHCYELPGLPRHNLQLEEIFGRKAPSATTGQWSPRNQGFKAMGPRAANEPYPNRRRRSLSLDSNCTA